MVAKAVVDSVIVTDAEVLLEANNRFAMVMQQFGGDEAMLAEMYGKTAEHDVVSATDYAPFGMQMVGRSFDAAGSTAYRYGFNGKENDNEVKGEGNQQDYGMRIYDPRLGKFLSVDPLTKSYPFYTPYQYAGNTPMQATDKDGGEPDFVLWRVALWVVKAKLTNAGDEFKKDIADHVQSSNNNYGRFDNARDISEQVRENQIKAFESKAKIAGTFAKGAAVSSAVIATPYVVAAGAVVLPELFAVSGIAQLNISGSYLAQKTVSAFINAAGQQVAS
jgi:RHS repeat-associated protein